MPVRTDERPDYGHRGRDPGRARDLARFVASGLDIVVAITGEEGHFLLSSQAFDLVILRTERDFLDGKGHREHDLPDGVSGRVGLWSKADSVVYFDEFVVEPLIR